MMEDIQVLWCPREPMFLASTGECVSAVDWLGNRFHVGDRVLYSIHAGSSTEVAIGEVLAIKSEHHERSRVGRNHPDGTEMWRSAWDKITVTVLTEKSSGSGTSRLARTRPAQVKAQNVTWVPEGFGKEDR
jgi:hypothetical protein